METRKLSPIQKRSKLNDVYAIGEKGLGRLYHRYVIVREGDDLDEEQHYGGLLSEIVFQKGAREELSSISGVLDTDLLEIVRDRLKSFQEGPLASMEAAFALTHIEEALMCLNRRLEDRIERE